MYSNYNLCLAMTANFQNYIEQFKTWFLIYNENYNYRINLSTNMPELFEDFKYDNLFIYSTKELISRCESTFEDESVLLNEVRYREYPWHSHRHIVKECFEQGYSRVMAIDSDIYINIDKKSLEDKIDNTIVNSISTTQSIWCCGESEKWEGQNFEYYLDRDTIHWVDKFNEKYGTNINMRGFCSYDGPDILYNMDSTTYKKFFELWDVMAEFDYKWYPYPVPPQRIYIALNSLLNMDTHYYGGGGLFMEKKHDQNIHYK